MRFARDQVLQLEWISLQVIELVQLALAAAIHPMDVFIALRTHGLVAHTDEPWQRLLGPVLDQERAPPRRRGARSEERHERSSLDLRAGRAASQLDHRGRDVLADDELLSSHAGLHEGRKAHNKRRADTLLVREATLRPEGVLAKKIAVVAKEKDERVVELLQLVERVEDHSDALIDRSHHGSAQPDFLLLTGVYGTQQRPGLIRLFEFERLRP